jgi:hypothetical protein
VQQWFVGDLLEISPQLVRPPQQRHIFRMLGVGKAKIRVTPTDAPSTFGTSNWSRAKTRNPRLANSYAVALPMLPVPTTMAS